MGFGPKYPFYNKLLGMFTNLPIGLPFSVTFKYYHMEHHRVSKMYLINSLPKVVQCLIFIIFFNEIPTKIGQVLVANTFT